MVGTTPCSAFRRRLSRAHTTPTMAVRVGAANSNPNSAYTPDDRPEPNRNVDPGCLSLLGRWPVPRGWRSLSCVRQPRQRLLCRLSFNRFSPPNTIAVNKGTFDGGGILTWGRHLHQSNHAPSIFNRAKGWIATVWHSASPFQDRVYVSWARFVFNPHNGRYVHHSFFSYSTDGGSTFSTPKHLTQRTLRSGHSSMHPVKRHPLRDLRGLHPAGNAQQPVDSEVDRRRRHLECTPVKIADVQDIITRRTRSSE